VTAVLTYDYMTLLTLELEHMTDMPDSSYVDKQSPTGVQTTEAASGYERNRENHCQECHEH